MTKCKVQDITNLLEELCPLDYAEKWDNVGLLVGSKEKEVTNIMVALDATDEVIEQAVEKKIDLLITHHPMIFSARKTVTNDDFIGRRILALIKNDISYYAMHTNCDIMAMADAAAEKIGLINTRVLEVTLRNMIKNREVGIGRVGILREQQTLESCALLVKERFQLDHVRVIGNLESNINKVAISTGSGKDFVKLAIEANADVLITGDIDHHTAIDSLACGLNIIDAGHFGTEHFMTELISEYIKNNSNKLLENNTERDSIVVLVAKEKDPFQII
ncbi:Nif3-like dinuclear metal center hexameric protein [Anaeromicropila herbilytica]|uniref:GTP cyclohydrolase 1 type 2 homolog n=1 Tax=Anaeromicropila herbilytica TaxID=2785025 RepID=A0A7R7IDZ8_9FIRM|nr:Nif3-like dinuclear metal center hexameric protein [Anaeromicropila herbilytica]BCN32238.1 GTP cyclohydrolase 1 type 2 [Anaeromicropila herbilytica]